MNEGFFGFCERAFFSCGVRGCVRGPGRVYGPGVDLLHCRIFTSLISIYTIYIIRWNNTHEICYNHDNPALSGELIVLFNLFTGKSPTLVSLKPLATNACLWPFVAVRSTNAITIAVSNASTKSKICQSPNGTVHDEHLSYTYPLY